MDVSISPDDVKVVNADDRGRVYLGTDFAGKKLEVAVLDVYE